MATVRKSVSISLEQDTFVKDQNLSLSRLLQKVIDKKIEDMKFLRQTHKNLREMKAGKYIEVDSNHFEEELDKW